MINRYVLPICVIALSLLVWELWTPPLANPCAASPPAKTVTGTVKAVSPDSLVVKGGTREWTFALSEAVVESVQKLKVGESVTVRYINADGKLTAVRVTPKTPSTTKKTPGM